MTGPLLLAFIIWMLLTSDFSWPNVLVGFIGSFIVSRFYPFRFSARQLILLILSAVMRIPQAVWETVLLVLLPHRFEHVESRSLKKSDDAWSVFCESFIITFTPKSLVISEESEGEVKLHTVDRKERS